MKHSSMVCVLGGLDTNHRDCFLPFQKQNSDTVTYWLTSRLMSKERSHDYRKFVVRKNAAIVVFRQLRNRDWNEDEGLELLRNEWTKAPKKNDTDHPDFTEQWDKGIQRILSGKPYTEYFEDAFMRRVLGSNRWDVTTSIEFEMQRHKLSDSIDFRYLIIILQPFLETAEEPTKQIIQTALEWLEQQEEAVRAWEKLQDQTQLVHVKYIARSYFPSRFLKDIERLPIELTLEVLETEYRLDIRFEIKQCKRLLDIVSRQLVITPTSQKLIAVHKWIKTWLEALTSPHCTEYLTNLDGRKGYYNKAVAERLLKVSPFHPSYWKWEHSIKDTELGDLNGLLTGTNLLPFITKQAEAQYTANIKTPVIHRARKERQLKIAELRNVSIDEVRAIFNMVKVGSLYNQPGEWAAALRALSVAGVLLGKVTQVDRWVTSQEFDGKTSSSILSTLKPLWYDSFNDAGDFLNKDHQTVFRTVKRAVEKLLQEKRTNH